MSTGDLKNNLRKLHAELKLVNYCGDLDVEGLSVGRPFAFLPILHYVLADFSLELAQYFYSKGYELLGKTDMKFVHVVYRILRDEFDLKPALTRDQFFTMGFAERKLQVVGTIIRLCRNKSEELKPKRKKTVGASVSKAARNQPSVIQSNSSKDSHKMAMPVTAKPMLDATSGNSQAVFLSDSGHAQPRSSPGAKTDTTGLTNVVVCNTTSEAPHDSMPRNTPVTYKFHKQIPRGNWPAKEHGKQVKSKYLAASSKEGIPLNCHFERKISPANQKANVQGIDSQDRNDKYDLDKPKQMHFFVDEGRVSYPKDVYIGEKCNEEEVIGSSQDDLALKFDELTTRQDNRFILEHFQAQQKRIELLERNVKEKEICLQTLAKTNSKLSARVMVLETAVTLLQEQIK